MDSKEIVSFKKVDGLEYNITSNNNKTVVNITINKNADIAIKDNKITISTSHKMTKEDYRNLLETHSFED